jgi:hypothetical protein
LAYRIIPDGWEWRPDVLVIAFLPRFRDPEAVVDREYREIKRFELFVSPEYDAGLSGRTELAKPREVARLPTAAIERRASSVVRAIALHDVCPHFGRRQALAAGVLLQQLAADRWGPYRYHCSVKSPESSERARV